MKPTKLFFITALLTIAALASTAFIRAKLLKTVNAAANGFAVVELFTSEGCSSCPPADALVARIAQESKDNPVYILAYHVDYWDRLGWKDAFSSADFSKRQYEYARYLHLQSVYTPQIVVNGKTEFVGSEEGALRNAIKTNLEKTSATQLSLKASVAAGGQIEVKYNAAPAEKGAALLLAVVQKNGKTKVERGENGGRTLSHVQIVRKLQKTPLKEATGSTKLSLPAGFNTQDWEVIGFVQNTGTGSITAATRAAF